VNHLSRHLHCLVWLPEKSENFLGENPLKIKLPDIKYLSEMRKIKKFLKTEGEKNGQVRILNDRPNNLPN